MLNEQKQMREGMDTRAKEGECETGKVRDRWREGENRSCLLALGHSPKRGRRDGDYAVVDVGPAVTGEVGGSGWRVCRRAGGGSLIVRIEGRHRRQLISLLVLLLLECARVPTSYSSNFVVVAVDGGFSGNADISSTI